MFIQHACIEFEIYVLSCQVYVTFSNKIPEVNQIEVEAKTIKITIANKVHLLEIEEYTFEKNSFREIQVQNNKLIFRAQLACSPSTEASCFTFVSNKMPSLKTAEKVLISCSGCKTLLSDQPFSFYRVLPVELWEVDTNMFCHGGTENLIFQPQENDCYYDKISLYIKNKLWRSHKIVICNNCNLCLGIGIEYGVRFWLDSIILKYDCDDVQMNVSSFDCFAVTMDNIIKAMLGPISHVIIEYRDSKNCSQFLSMKVIKKCEIAVCINSSEKNVLKLTRKNCSSIIWHTSSEFIEEWKNNFLVTEIQVSERMYQCAVSYLTFINQTFLSNNNYSGKEKPLKSYMFEENMLNAFNIKNICM
ncbi:uncharacterized protein LOC126834786 [Adelges cooleyi]|uniref:uncharacterized protein LOC126834786 n=1 Tax=Adelges cooleyi TaxID=133065 RepID=UPI00217F7508|nr:uncharacterized protein LOC126834786 [Adelges cooleyi]